MKQPHPAKGKTPYEYQEYCRAKREQARIDAEIEREKAERLRVSGWDDTSEILKVLHSYNADNPYSLAKFTEDFKRIEVRKEQIATGEVTN